MKNCIILIIAGLLLAYQNISGQGCIAVRSMSCASGSINNPTSFLRKGDFQLGMSYRYLHSYKHFVGKEEQTQRVAEKTNVINTSNNFDLGVTYAFSDRFNFAINLPVATNVRSSLYEHYGNSVEANPDRKRFNSGSAGVGDMRFTGNYWLLDPAKHHEANFSLGLSLKMPTGNPNVTDQFHKRTKTGADSLITKYVDQSIQLGDSGWGYGIESQGFSMLGRKSSMYYNLFYLLSPKNINPVTGLSVPDQFGARLGATTMLLEKQGIAVSLGGRFEGLPAIDLIGKSEGFRRPGYILSIEPGIFWVKKQHVLSLTVPYALIRNRTKNFTDRQDPAGLKHGDAAFADYLITASYAIRLGNKNTNAKPLNIPEWNK